VGTEGERKNPFPFPLPKRRGLMQNLQFAAIPSLSEDFPKERLGFYPPPRRLNRKRENEKGLILSETEAMMLLGCSKKTLQHLKDYAGLACIYDEDNRTYFCRNDISDFMSFTNALLEGRM